MDQELLISLAETKSLLKEWAKQSPKNQRWLSVVSAITKLQVHLAPKVDNDRAEDQDDTVSPE